jgi:RNA polymerase sigma factor (sigma-70 family)
MQAMDDMALLREYATSNSEAAFETLVSRRVNFVYSAALRQVRNADLAGEVTQAVFIVLAQKAGRISDKTVLTGWLFKTTRFAALAQIRAAARRRRYEQEAQMQSELQPSAPDLFWEQMSPLLDEALATLGETDRQAVLLRFFENKSLAEVGSHWGTGEDTTRKRISRALEKLRHYFSKRGVSSTTAIIAGAISANSVQAAPVALAKSITAVAIAKGAAAGGSTLTLIKGALKIMAWTKAKTTVIAVVILATTTTGVVGYKLVQAHRASNRPQLLSNIFDLQSDGSIRFQATIEEVNYTSKIIQHEYDFKIGATVHLDQIKDEHGYPIAFTTKQRDKYNRVNFSFALDKPIPPGGRIVFTMEGTIPNLIQPNDKFFGSNIPPFLVATTNLVQPTDEPGVYKFLLADQPGGVYDRHRVEVYQLPPGATLLDKTPVDAQVTTNGDRVELRVDKIVPPKITRWEVSFRYRLPAAAK